MKQAFAPTNNVVSHVLHFPPPIRNWVQSVNSIWVMPSIHERRVELVGAWFDQEALVHRRGRVVCFWQDRRYPIPISHHPSPNNRRGHCSKMDQRGAISCCTALDSASWSIVLKRNAHVLTRIYGDDRGVLVSWWRRLKRNILGVHHLYFFTIWRNNANSRSCKTIEEELGFVSYHERFYRLLLLPRQWCRAPTLAGFNPYRSTGVHTIFWLCRYKLKHQNNLTYIDWFFSLIYDSQMELEHYYFSECLEGLTSSHSTVNWRSELRTVLWSQFRLEHTLFAQ